MLQFREMPTPATVDALQRQGVKVLSDVPLNGLLVSVTGTASLAGLGVHYAQPIAPQDKISSLAAGLRMLARRLIFWSNSTPTRI